MNFSFTTATMKKQTMVEMIPMQKAPMAIGVAALLAILLRYPKRYS